MPWILPLALAAALPAPPTDADRCHWTAEIVRDVILPAEAKRQYLVFEDRAFSWWKDRLPVKPIATREKGEVALLNAWLDEPHASAVTECSDVRALLRRQRIGFGEKAVRAAKDNNDEMFRPGHQRDPSKHRMTVYGIAMPTFNADGTEAVLEKNYDCGSLCGGGNVVKVRRDPDGSWRKVAEWPLWIS